MEKRGTMPDLQYMRETYETLHRHPELSGQEVWTADFVAKELAGLGFALRTNLGGTGLMGMLEFAHPGQTLALRCDMDALPIQEETGVSYASQNQGVMHACGHDSHMATLLGVCRYAAKHKDRFSGTLMVVFQHAEEIVVGAKAMLEAGLFSQHLPGRLVAIHNWPSLPAGTLGLQQGPITAYADRFKATFHGQGGHGAFPWKSKDPIAMATTGIQDAFSLAQRRSDTSFPQTLSFGMIHGGTRFNVIPQEVVVEGTVRACREEDQERMIDNLHQAFAAGASLHGGEYVLEYQKGVPAVINDSAVVDELGSAFATKISETPVIQEGLASLIGEDVAYYLQMVPGALLLVGSGQEGFISELHHPGFLVPNKTLETGYKALTSIMEMYLS